MFRDSLYACSFSQFLRLFPFLLTITALAGCSSGVERAAHTQFQAPQFDDLGEQAGGLDVKLSREAKDDATDNLKFNKGDLEATIRRDLEINNLLAAQYDSGLPTIEVTVTSVRVRSSFSAIMFGFMAGDDHIDGDVVVRAADGNVLQKFSVSASYALGGFAGGQDSSRLSWLYETFAEHVAQELTGKSKEDLKSSKAFFESSPGGVGSTHSEAAEVGQREYWVSGTPPANGTWVGTDGNWTAELIVDEDRFYLKAECADVINSEVSGKFDDNGRIYKILAPGTWYRTVASGTLNELHFASGFSSCAKATLTFSRFN
jgi:hypothetical protein